ncbi:MAG: hypothetical protein IPJ85_11320 [Flavobacteriales bacterium]|nr:hypothetical protein [Flavobacteriales bacterium]
MRSTSGNYHVALRHRNHLKVMSAAPVALSTSSALLDFSIDGTTTFGTNAQRTSGGTFSKQVMWSGDVDKTVARSSTLEQERRAILYQCYWRQCANQCHKRVFAVG